MARRRKIFSIGQIRFSTRPIMRYDTVGDWFDTGTIEIYEGLSDIEKLAVGTRMMVEMILLRLQKVNQRMVDRWDMKQNGTYDETMFNNDERYKKAYQYARSVECMIVKTAGLTWEEYSNSLNRTRVRWENKEKRKKIAIMNNNFVPLSKAKDMLSISKQSLHRRFHKGMFPNSYLGQDKKNHFSLKDIKKELKFRKKLQTKYISLVEIAQKCHLTTGQINKWKQDGILPKKGIFRNKQYFHGLTFFNRKLIEPIIAEYRQKHNIQD